MRAESIHEYRDRQAEKERELLERYVPWVSEAEANYQQRISLLKAKIDQEKQGSEKAKLEQQLQELTLSRFDHLPPGFVPIGERFPGGKIVGKKHSYISVHHFDGHKTDLQDRPIFIVDGTPSVRNMQIKIAELRRAGLADHPEDAHFDSQVESAFNASFADGGKLTGENGLVSILDGLPKIKIDLTEIDGVKIVPFHGEIEVVNDTATHEIAVLNPLGDYQGSIARSGSFPTFEMAIRQLDRSQELPPKEMLEFRKELAEALGLPLHLSKEEIERVWTNHLGASYNMWADNTEKLMRSAGKNIKLPPFKRVLEQGGLTPEDLGTAKPPSGQDLR